MYTLPAYLVYLLLSVFTVLVVGRSLHRNGKVYLFGECRHNQVSTSANNFLYVCYCLLNCGFALFFLGSNHRIGSWAEAIEFIAGSQGFILIVLGSLHVLNVLFVPPIIEHFIIKKLLTNKNQKS